MIEVQELVKTFNKGKVRAVDGVSFSAKDGQITGLLGPNGAGKTTTLRMLYTLLPPETGRMAIDGINPTDDSVGVKRAIGVVPDSRGLYDRLTAKENIAYFGRLHGLSQSRIDQQIQKFCDVLDMSLKLLLVK